MEKLLFPAGREAEVHLRYRYSFGAKKRTVGTNNRDILFDCHGIVLTIIKMSVDCIVDRHFLLTTRIACVILMIRNEYRDIE